MSFTAWQRFRERKIAQWGVAYLAGGWVLLQVLALLSNTYRWPPVIMRVAPVVLGVGLLVLLVIVWYHTEQGRQRVSGPELTILASLFLLGGAGMWLAARGQPLAQPAVSVAVPMAFGLELPDSLQLSFVGSWGAIALSQDGSTLVFQATPRGSSVQALYVRHLDDPAVQLIGGTENGRLPSLSADGKDLVFLDGDNALKRVPVQGGLARTLATSGAPASWIDSDQIVYGGFATSTALGSSRGLFTVTAEGGVPTLLASPDSTRNHLGYGFPTMLPDGSGALISIWKGANVLDSIWLGVVSIPGGRVTELGVRGTNPKYSPSGHILFATADKALLAVPFSVRSRRVTGVPITVYQGLETGTGGAGAFTIAQNGTVVYIRSASSLGTALTAVGRSGIERPISPEPGWYYSPRFSPDGRKIAMTVAASASITGSLMGNLRHNDIWILEVPSQVMTRLTTDSASALPSWSPEGERLGYMTQSGIVRVTELQASATPTTLFRSPVRISSMSFGGGHGYVGLEVRQPSNLELTADVWIAHMDSVDSPRAVVAAPYREHGPRISPDGRLLAYTSNRTGSLEVYVRPIFGGGEEIRASTAGGTEPVWAPDGRELFFRAPQHLMAARLADGPRLEIVARDTLFVDHYLRSNTFANYDISLDGSEFVMVSAAQAGEGETNALILLNWAPESGASSEAGP